MKFEKSRRAKAHLGIKDASVPVPIFHDARAVITTRADKVKSGVVAEHWRRLQRQARLYGGRVVQNVEGSKARSKARPKSLMQGGASMPVEYRPAAPRDTLRDRAARSISRGKTVGSDTK